MIKEYTSVTNVIGPLIVVEGIEGVSYGEIAQIKSASGDIKYGQVLEIGEGKAIVQVFQGTTGIDTKTTKVRFSGETMRLNVSTEMLGRVFNGMGKPIDGQPEIVAEQRLDVNGNPMNPYSREMPEDFIQTGVSAIDIMNTLVRGQKLPIFSGSGLPHNKLAAQIARQAKVLGKNDKFAVVFAAMGITYEEAEFFRSEFEKSGALNNVIMFLNLANDPAIERIITPRIALTTAEYLAFEKDMHILVVLTDLTNYCEALREIAAARNEVPGRRGYPGYMYTDLSQIYERAGRIKGKKGTLTQMPIISMPDDDITHPIPDLTGYITEGQFVLSRDIHRQNIYAPVDVLPSLSRLMNKGIGDGKTREDHAEVANQLYAAYARGRELRDLVSVIGKESLSAVDVQFLDFADAYEKKFVNQGYHEERDVIESLNLAWKLLSMLPKEELRRIKRPTVEKYYGKQ